MEIYLEIFYVKVALVYVVFFNVLHKDKEDYESRSSGNEKNYLIQELSIRNKSFTMHLKSIGFLSKMMIYHVFIILKKCTQSVETRAEFQVLFSETNRNIDWEIFYLSE